MFRTACRVSSLVRNFSGRTIFFSKCFSTFDHNASQLFRNSQECHINYMGSRKFSSSSMYVIEMRGLDPDSTEEEVINFFKSLNITPANVRFRCDPSGRAAGTCEVDFETHSEALVAMRKKNSFIGNRFVRLKLISTGFGGDKGGNLKPNEPKITGDSDLHDVVGGITKNMSSTGHFIRMKGLPHRVTEQAIYDFFWPVHVKPISIKRVYGDNGRPTKEVDVEFLTHEEAVTAMSKNNACFGRQFVELMLNSTGDTTQAGVTPRSEISNIGESRKIGIKNI